MKDEETPVISTANSLPPELALALWLAGVILWACGMGWLSFAMGRRLRRHAIAAFPDFKETASYESYASFVAHDHARSSLYTPLRSADFSFPSPDDPDRTVAQPVSPQQWIIAQLSTGSVPTTLPWADFWQSYAAVPLPPAYMAMPLPRLPYPFRDFLRLARRYRRRVAVGMSLSAAFPFLVLWSVDTLHQPATFTLPLGDSHSALFALALTVVVAWPCALAGAKVDLGTAITLNGSRPASVDTAAIPEPDAVATIPWSDDSLLRQLGATIAVPCAYCRGSGQVTIPGGTSTETRWDPNANEGMGGSYSVTVQVPDSSRPCAPCKGRGSFSFSADTLASMVVTLNDHIATYNALLPVIKAGIRERNRALLWRSGQLTQWLQT